MRCPNLQPLGLCCVWQKLPNPSLLSSLCGGCPPFLPVLSLLSVRLDCVQTTHCGLERRMKMEKGLLKIMLDHSTLISRNPIHPSKYKKKCIIFYTTLCIKYQILDYSRLPCIILCTVQREREKCSQPAEPYKWSPWHNTLERDNTRTGFKFNATGN